MANDDRAYGARPIKGPSRITTYTLATANSLIGKGDFLSVTAAGFVDKSSATDTVIIGVAAEAKAASDGGEIAVSDHPDTTYVMQTNDGTTGLVTRADMNQNADFIAAAPTFGVSRMEIDSTSKGTTNTLPLKILKLYASENNAFGEFNELEFMINNHVRGGGPGTAGI